MKSYNFARPWCSTVGFDASSISSTKPSTAPRIFTVL